MEAVKSKRRQQVTSWWSIESGTNKEAMDEANKNSKIPIGNQKIVSTKQLFAVE